MLINSPNISGSLNVSGNTVITGSLTTSIAALNTPATTFLTSNNGTIRSRTAAQTLSDIGAQATGSYVTVSNASNLYVPYTGATASVNLGYNSLAASNINIDGNAPTAGSYLGFKQATTVNTGVAGYTSISTFGTNRMTFSFAQPTGFRSVSFTVSEITQNVSGGRVYTMPDSNGTLALTSNLGAYLPLTGGTITGSLTVTGDVIAQTLNVQEVTSSIVYSSGSNVFGNDVSNTQQFTGSMLVTGSLNVTGTGTFSSTVTAGSGLINGTTDAFFDLNRSASGNAGRVRFQTAGTDEFEIGLKGGVAGFHITKGDATELVTVLTSGNVGIGTTVPSAGLEIETDGSAKTALRVTSNQAFNASPVTAIMFRYRISSGTTIGGAVINAAKDNATENNQAGNLQFWTNNGSTLAERMQISSGGNLGLGVTPNIWFSDRRAFQIQSGGSINGSISTPSFVELGANFFHGSLGDTYISTTQATKYRQLSGAHEWYNAPSGTAGNAITFTQAMTLDASGRLGIGTSSPSARLHVANSAGGVVAFLQSTATNGEPTLSLEGRNSSGTVRSATFKYDNTDILRLGTSSPIDFRFETNDVERMRIASGGLITVTGTGAGANSEGIFFKRTSNLAQGGYINGNGGVLQIVATNEQSSLNGNIYFQRYNGTSTTTSMVIDSSGNVGIGTTSPPSRLSVQWDKSTLFAGAAIYDSQVFNASNHGGTLAFGGTFNSAGAYTEWSAIGGMKSNTTDGNVSGDINFYTRLNSSAMTERMRITSDNNILFNTDSTSSTNTSSFIFRSGTTAYSGVMVMNHATTNNTGAGFIDCYYNTNYIGGIQQNGTSNISFSTSSDYRLKEDLKDFNGLNLISNLKVYDFKWKTENSRMYGVIAHELQEIIPYTVSGNKDEIKENGKIKVQVVDYSKLVPVLVKAIQELKAENDTLKSRIDTLEQA